MKYLIYGQKNGPFILKITNYIIKTKEKKNENLKIGT